MYKTIIFFPIPCAWPIVSMIYPRPIPSGELDIYSHTLAAEYFSFIEIMWYMVWWFNYYVSVVQVIPVNTSTV